METINKLVLKSMNISEDKKNKLKELFPEVFSEDKIDFESVLAITPNQRYTKHTIQASKEIEGICTGIVRHGVNYFSKESTNKKWGFIATYGVQSLVPDKLGMAIFYEIETVSEVTEWEHDYLLVFKPSTKAISFYFLGAWEQEKDGIKTEAEFLSYLDEKLNELKLEYVLIATGGSDGINLASLGYRVIWFNSESEQISYAELQKLKPSVQQLLLMKVR